MPYRVTYHHFRRHAFALVALILVLQSCDSRSGSASSSSPPAPAPSAATGGQPAISATNASTPVLAPDAHHDNDDPTTVSWHDQQGEVVAKLVLDRLEVELTAGRVPPGDALTRAGMALEPEGRPGRFIALFAAVANRDALESRARDLATALTDDLGAGFGIANVRILATTPDGQRLTITRRVSVVLAPGADPVAIAADSHCAVVETADLPAGVAVFEALSANALAAVDAAADLGSTDGVTAATPLVERQLIPK
jgi:hypothetical protein